VVEAARGELPRAGRVPRPALHREVGLDADATFRDLAPTDLAAGLALCRKIGWNQTEADWRALLEPPSVFRAAEVGGRVVGTAGAVGYGRDLAWVCMVIVDPDSRGLGLASRLVSDVLDRVSDFAVVGLDATPQGRPVYARLGFADGPALARMETSAERAAPSLGAARPLRDADLDAVLRWDRQVFGADRSRVLRMAFATAPEYAWVVEGDGLEACCFGRHGHNAEQVGPVVARTTGAARDVVAAALASRPDRRFFLDVTAEGREVAMSLGFSQQRPFTRMYRGPSLPSSDALFAVFGPEFG
jgi:GNAT superfamily N-acetyltransferase